MPLIVIGDFNVEIENNAMSNFCDTFDVTSLIGEPTYYKNKKIQPAWTLS